MRFNLDAMVPYKDEVKAALLRAVDEQHYILGYNTAKFEEEFARFTGTAHCVGVGNGTDAIRLALLALGVKPGDEVITPAFNVAYTALAVESIGAKNVYVDVEPDTLLLDVTKVDEAITPRTRVIVPVHMFGQMCYMPAFFEQAQRYGLMVLEDAAQAHGAVLQGHGPGRYSHAVSYSFYPTKNLGALGEAGAVTTNIDAVAERAKLLRDGGRTDRYLHIMPGINSCLDDLQAAVLSVKLKYLSTRNTKRMSAANYYTRKLEGVGDIEFLDRRPGDVYHLYSILTDHRDALVQYLRARGIPSLIHYPVPVPYQPCFLTATMGGPWPVAERQARRVMSLPLHPDISVVDQDRVITAIKAYFEGV